MELTDRQYELADQIEALLERHSGKTWTPSAIARGIRSTTDDVRPVLQYMTARRYITAAGNGARTRYAAR